MNLGKSEIEFERREEKMSIVYREMCHEHNNFHLKSPIDTTLKRRIRLLRVTDRKTRLKPKKTKTFDKTTFLSSFFFTRVTIAKAERIRFVLT